MPVRYRIGKALVEEDTDDAGPHLTEPRTNELSMGAQRKVAPVFPPIEAITQLH